MLNNAFKTLDEIPETINLREHAVQLPDGSYRLDIAGFEKKSIWEDFESLKEAARKERENTDAAKKVGREIKTERDEMRLKIEAYEKEGKNLSKEEIIEAEKNKLRITELETLLEESTGKFNSLQAEVDGGTIKEAFRAYLGDKIKPEAINDAIDLYTSKFSVVNGEPLTNQENGGNVGMSVNQFFDSVLPQKPHWAKSSTSANAQSGSGEKSNNQEKFSFRDKLDFK